jgi:hypothetical protein
MMRKRAEEAFILYKTLLSWKLHQKRAQGFDAWDYNFNTNMKFATFLGSCFVQGQQANGAYRSSARLAAMGVPVEEYLNYVVVTCGEYTNTQEVASEERLKAYFSWKERSKPREMVEEDFAIEGGVVAFMRDNSIPDIIKAEIISKSNSWEKLWALKPQCNFMFEVYWSRIHCYRGLYVHQ